MVRSTFNNLNKMKKGLNYIASPSNQVVECDKAKFLDSKAIAEHAEVPLSSGRWGGSGGVACVGVSSWSY